MVLGWVLVGRAVWIGSGILSISREGGTRHTRGTVLGRDAFDVVHGQVGISFARVCIGAATNDHGLFDNANLRRDETVRRCHERGAGNVCLTVRRCRVFAVGDHVARFGSIERENGRGPRFHDRWHLQAERPRGLLELGRFAHHADCVTREHNALLCVHQADDIADAERCDGLVVRMYDGGVLLWRCERGKRSHDAFDGAESLSPNVETGTVFAENGGAKRPDVNRGRHVGIRGLHEGFENEE
mmetsp:Transcript_17443/g.54099  ORF Transcript_17443/g.54099 Transcript_17443/m.54099 type:complete len:243 (+) Transcript_17443:270-998(+)